MSSQLQEVREDHDMPDPPPKPPDSVTRSFKDALVQNDALKDRADTRKNDEEMKLQEEDEKDDGSDLSAPFIIDSELKAKACKPWRTSIILKLMGSQMPLSVMVRRLSGLWKPKGGLQLIDLGHEFCIAKFELEEDMIQILESGPWFMGSQYIAMTKWRPDFHPATARILSMAVWIRFANLPMEFYDSDVLWQLARRVGKPVRIDAITLAQTRGRFARICVEINMDKALVHTINCGSFFQKVQYESLPLLCFQCGKLGHDRKECSLKELSTSSTPQLDEHDKDGNYGTWMLVAKKSARKTANFKDIQHGFAPVRRVPDTVGESGGPQLTKGPVSREYIRTHRSTTDIVPKAKPRAHQWVAANQQVTQHAGYTCMNNRNPNIHKKLNLQTTRMSPDLGKNMFAALKDSEDMDVSNQLPSSDVAPKHLACTMTAEHACLENNDMQLQKVTSVSPLLQPDSPTLLLSSPNAFLSTTSISSSSKLPTTKVANNESESRTTAPSSSSNSRDDCRPEQPLNPHSVHAFQPNKQPNTTFNYPPNSCEPQLLPAPIIVDSTVDSSPRELLLDSPTLAKGTCLPMASTSPKHAIPLPFSSTPTTADGLDPSSCIPSPPKSYSSRFARPPSKPIYTKYLNAHSTANPSPNHLPSHDHRRVPKNDKLIKRVPSQHSLLESDFAVDAFCVVSRNSRSRHHVLQDPCGQNGDVIRDETYMDGLDGERDSTGLPSCDVHEVGEPKSLPTYEDSSVEC